MDAAIEFIGRDWFVVIVLFIAVNIRAGKPEKVPVVQGLTLAFTPFFVVLCILYVFEYGLSLFGLMIPAKVMGSMAGLFGYIGNSWLIGLTKNGKDIEEGGALASMGSLIKSIVNFKKTV